MHSFRLAGVDVPRIGLGTNRLRSEHVQFIRDAVAAGVRHIDTAHLYTGGESERTIGEALEGVGEEVLVATKGGYRGAGPEVLDAEIEQSLRSLRTDAIGLYYLHRVDPDTPLEESLGAIKAHVDRGAIRHVGVSEVSVDQIERARRVVPIAAVQNRYNRGDRSHDDVVDHCEREGIAFVPYYPLAGEGDNADKLAWLLQRSPVILPIPGTLSIEHLRENLAAL
jgi:pyridoxine 4-dehydrogenase